MTWIEDLTRKRAANYSAVVVVETNDDRRVQEYINSRAVLGNNGEIAGYQDTLVWDTFMGMRELSSRGEKSVEPDPIEGGIGAIMDFFKDPNNKARVAIIKNILGPNDLPMKAINSWSMDDDLFARRDTVVLFVPDRSLVNAKVLDKCIFLSPPYSTPSERLLIVNSLFKDFDIRDAKPIDGLIQATGGLDLNQTEAVIGETLQAFRMGKLKQLDTSVVSRAKADIINKSPALQIKKDLAFGFERIGGYDALKSYIKKTIIMPLKDPERAKALGMDLPRGMILFGPGGTGKTVITKAIAKEIGMPFVTLNPENFMTSLVGESEKNLRNAFRLMREMSPVICFLDEIDRLGGRGKSGESDGGTSSRIFSMFLDELGDEDRKYFVVGATNMPFLDPAFIRPGRFDCLIPMLSPDLKARKEIFNVHLNVVRRVPNDITPQQIEDLASMMDGWKGNMIEELVKRATRMAFDDGCDHVAMKHMLLAKDDYQVNQKALQEDEAKYVDAAEKLCNSKTFLDAMHREREIRTQDGRRKSLKEE